MPVVKKLKLWNVPLRDMSLEAALFILEHIPVNKLLSSSAFQLRVFGTSVLPAYGNTVDVQPGFVNLMCG